MPSGDDSSFGVASVQAAVRTLEKVPDMSPLEMAKRMRTLKGYADDLMQCCCPSKNPEAFRRCQEAAKPACEGLLVLAQSDRKPELCTAALTALVCVCLDNLENASVVVTSASFQPTLSFSLQPIMEIRQQEQVLAALQLLQSLCAAAPEAPALVPLLPCVVDLLSNVAREGHAPCCAVRMTALEVLVSCSLSNHRRLQLSALLPESVLTSVLNDAESNPSTMTFPVGLLLANLSDLSETLQSGDVPENSFKRISCEFWERTNFFHNLQACLAATLQSEAWPPQSGIFHSSWKLANTYLRLTRTGMHDELRDAIVLLTALVEQRGDDEQVLGCEEARAARLAVQVLHNMATDTLSLSLMKQAQKLTSALVKMQHEEPAAQDLLHRLAKGVSGVASVAEAPGAYISTISKPW